MNIITFIIQRKKIANYYTQKVVVSVKAIIMNNDDKENVNAKHRRDNRTKLLFKNFYRQWTRLFIFILKYLVSECF